MIFANKKFYGVQSSSFINDYKIVYGFLGGAKKNNKISPNDTTSIDKSKEKAILKAYSEHSERFLLNAQEDKIIKSINIITNEIEELNALDFSYEPSSPYLKSDTTGTAAGLTSYEIIQKAVLELIEKNEMLLLWYGKKGYFLKHNEYIKNLIRNLNLTSPNIDLFVSKNLCNFYTVVTVAYDNTKITSSGVSVSKNLEDAINLSLREAKIIEWANPFLPISDNIHLEAINHTKYLKESLQNYDFLGEMQKPQEKLIINPFIKTLNIGILNTHLGKRPITVKCISKELFNCLPSKDRLALDYNRKILKEFNINEETIINTPNCILR